MVKFKSLYSSLLNVIYYVVHFLFISMYIERYYGFSHRSRSLHYIDRTLTHNVYLKYDVGIYFVTQVKQAMTLIMPTMS
jgi:hypothetical protein